MNLCVFCGNGPLTKEHAIPSWMRQLYPQVSFFTNERVGGKPLEWSSNHFDLQARVVCANCNHGWMAQLEGDVQPIIHKLFSLQETILITKADQEKLSFWIQKTILMLNQATPESVVITEELYNEIYTGKTFSKRARVEIGRRDTPLTNTTPIVSFYITQLPSVYVHKEIRKAVEEQKEQGGFIWKAILAIGPIVFMVVGHNMKIELEPISRGNALKVIQPYSLDIRWPTDILIEQEGGLEALMSVS